jgi:hypothetical protein
LKEHTDLNDLTQSDLEKFETTCLSEEQDQRDSDHLPPLRHQSSASSASLFEQTTRHTDNLERSASSVDFGHEHAEINFHLSPGEPNTPSRNVRQKRNGNKSANGTDGNPEKKSVHFGDGTIKKHDGKKPRLQASDIPARLPWNKGVPKTAADFIKLLFVCIHTGDPRYRYDASVDNVQKDEHQRVMTAP